MKNLNGELNEIIEITTDSKLKRLFIILKENFLEPKQRELQIKLIIRYITANMDYNEKYLEKVNKFLIKLK